MKIILLTQWFDPEPTLKGLIFAKELLKQGFEVEVITGFPNYPGGKLYQGFKIKIIQKEIIDGVKITRLPLYPSHNLNKFSRALNYVSFFFSSTFYGLFFTKRPNLIYAYHPPLTTGLSSIIIKLFRKIPLVLDIQDIWPDTLYSTKIIKKGLAYKLINNTCNFVYRHSDFIVVLSSGFKSLLSTRGVSKKKIKIIYNWCNKKFIQNSSYKENFNFSKIEGFKIVYAGNIGKAQGLNILLKTANLVQKNKLKVKFIIIGQGIELSKLKNNVKKMNLDNVLFFPRVSSEKVSSMLYLADALFIHLIKDPLFEVTIPGKTQHYMSIGKPILMGVSGESKNIIDRSRCGVSFEPENEFALLNAIKKILSMNKDELNLMGKNGQRFYDDHFSFEKGVNAFSKLFRYIIDAKNNN